MSFEWVTPGLLGLLVAIVLWIALRRPPDIADAEREARELRDEIARSAQGTRQEIVATIGDFQRTPARAAGRRRADAERADRRVRPQLADDQQQLGARSARRRSRRSSRPGLARDSLDQALESQGTRQATSLKDLSATLSQQLEALGARQRPAHGRGRGSRSTGGSRRSSRTTRRSSSRSAPPSTRSCTRRSSSASARASARSPSGSSRCIAASARCRSSPATSARSAAC
jgi:hypothetical protein